MAPRGFRRYRPAMPPFDLGVFGGILAGLLFLGLCSTVLVQESLFGYNALFGSPIVYMCGFDPRLSLPSPPPATWPILDNYLSGLVGPPEDLGMKLSVLFVILSSLLAAWFFERKFRERAVDREIRERSVILAAAGIPGSPCANRLPAPITTGTKSCSLKAKPRYDY